MASRRRAALAAIALLPSLALGACAPEPEPVPTLEPEPTPTAEPTDEPNALGSRVPVDCATTLGAGGFGEITVEPPRPLSQYLEATLSQSGFELCHAVATLAGREVELSLIVAPENVSSTMSVSEEWARDAGLPVDFAGEASYTDCIDDPDLPYCFLSVATATYSFNLAITPQDTVGAGFTDAVVGVGTQLVEASRAWSEPGVPWQRAAGSMVMGYGCVDEVAEIDAPLRAAVPWSLGEPEFTGSGDGQAGYFWMKRSLEVTECSWNGEGAGGSVSVLLVPGAAWQYDEGIALPEGEPADIDGALAATQTSRNASNASYAAYIDGSFLEVSVSVPFQSEYNPDAVARDVIAALVEAF